MLYFCKLDLTWYLYRVTNLEINTFKNQKGKNALRLHILIIWTINRPHHPNVDYSYAYKVHIGVERSVLFQNIFAKLTMHKKMQFFHLKKGEFMTYKNKSVSFKYILMVLKMDFLLSFFPNMLQFIFMTLWNCTLSMTRIFLACFML